MCVGVGFEISSTLVLDRVLTSGATGSKLSGPGQFWVSKSPDMELGFLCQNTLFF